jgi:hypothetical protein
MMKPNRDRKGALPRNLSESFRAASVSDRLFGSLHIFSLQPMLYTKWNQGCETLG